MVSPQTVFTYPLHHAKLQVLKTNIWTFQFLYNGCLKERHKRTRRSSTVIFQMMYTYPSNLVSLLISMYLPLFGSVLNGFVPSTPNSENKHSKITSLCQREHNMLMIPRRCITARSDIQAATFSMIISLKKTNYHKLTWNLPTWCQLSNMFWNIM